MSRPVSCKESRGKINSHYSSISPHTHTQPHQMSTSGLGVRVGIKVTGPLERSAPIPTIPLVSIIPSLSWAPQRGRMGRGASRSINRDNLLALTPFKWRPIIQVSLSLSFSNAWWRKWCVGKGAKEWSLRNSKTKRTKQQNWVCNFLTRCYICKINTEHNKKVYILCVQSNNGFISSRFLPWPKGKKQEDSALVLFSSP